jgi:uncharacterized protein YkwD
MSAIAEILLFILLVGYPNIGVVLPTPTPAPIKQVLSLQTPPNDSMLVLVNYERQKVGLNTLKENSLLDSSAKVKACDLLNKGYWAHIAPDGTTPWNLIIKAGYKYIRAGENLCSMGNDVSCMESFMNSPTHKANILGRYKEMGIGRCGKFTTQHFGSR